MINQFRNRDNIVESGYSTGTRQGRGDPPGKESEQIQYIDADNCQVNTHILMFSEARRKDFKSHIRLYLS